jgi:hypothetical protein
MATSYDAKGFPYQNGEFGAVRLTLCCSAAASMDQDGVTYCKGCYSEVHPAYGEVPTI